MKFLRLPPQPEPARRGRGSPLIAPFGTAVERPEFQKVSLAPIWMRRGERNVVIWPNSELVMLVLPKSLGLASVDWLLGPVLWITSSAPGFRYGRAWKRAALPRLAMIEETSAAARADYRCRRRNSGAPARRPNHCLRG
jgi:hypothetical protein